MIVVLLFVCEFAGSVPWVNRANPRLKAVLYLSIVTFYLHNLHYVGGVDFIVTVGIGIEEVKTFGLALHDVILDEFDVRLVNSIVAVGVATLDGSRLNNVCKVLPAWSLLIKRLRACRHIKRCIVIACRECVAGNLGRSRDVRYDELDIVVIGKGAALDGRDS